MCTVSIVDDEVTTRWPSCWEQEREILTASDGEEALERLSDIPRPSLIVLDLTMPRMDGWEVFRRQSADPSIAAISIIVLFGSGLPAGAKHQLAKPMDVERLVAFRDYGHQVDFGKVRAQIGKGGHELMPVFLSEAELKQYGKELESHRRQIDTCPGLKGSRRSGSYLNACWMRANRSCWPLQPRKTSSRRTRKSRVLRTSSERRPLQMTPRGASPIPTFLRRPSRA
jgi:CheY-like chemotaxis protein